MGKVEFIIDEREVLRALLAGQDSNDELPDGFSAEGLEWKLLKVEMDPVPRDGRPEPVLRALYGSGPKQTSVLFSVVVIDGVGRHHPPGERYLVDLGDPQQCEYFGIAVRARRPQEPR